MKIPELHKQVDEYMTQLGIPTFKRIQNNKNRLADGYIFLGNDEYLAVGLSDVESQKSKAFAVCFVIEFTKDVCHLQIDIRDDVHRRTVGTEINEADLKMLAQKTGARIKEGTRLRRMLGQAANWRGAIDRLKADGVFEVIREFNDTLDAELP